MKNKKYCVDLDKTYRPRIKSVFEGAIKATKRMKVAEVSK